MTCLNRFLLFMIVAVICSGCAHPITITPNSARLGDEKNQPRIEKAVAYYISEENRALRVTTPAGGGDSVEYAPYADLEPGFSQVLSNVFSKIYVIKDVNDRAFLQQNNIAWVFTPAITTSSSSRNNFFWPPTDFSMTIDCSATDTVQQPVWQTTIKASGDLIAVKEILKDHGMVGKSAAEKALNQLQNQLQAAPEFRR